MTLFPDDPPIFDPDFAVPQDVVAKHGSTYDLDLATGQFVDDGLGSVAVLTDQEAFEQLLVKALETRRATFLAYTHQFGHDYGAYLDTNPADTATREGLLESHIADCLLAVRMVDAVRDIVVEVIDLGTNEVHITATVVDTFGSSVTLDHTLNA